MKGPFLPSHDFSGPRSLHRLSVHDHEASNMFRRPKSCLGTAFGGLIPQKLASNLEAMASNLLAMASTY